MKQINRFILSIVVLISAMSLISAQEKSTDDKNQTADLPVIRKVEAKFVCMGMGNNRVFDRELIPAVVDGKTYYGCCEGCQATLLSDSSSRVAIDPISGKKVDKATATIGALREGEVNYFENEENMQKFGNLIKKGD